ncbi:hypothetical protein [Jiella pacifica]|uniref:Uncharacterized protein n=1 Tax=Jiella pacifica TaxID=2696469 RepID=A0A6N9SZV0_9HYPH|nr:hypothetical protein [Jiella pacifica]NDW04643.1 hypothetical protein [Jiella pacifica]
MAVGHVEGGLHPQPERLVRQDGRGVVEVLAEGKDLVCAGAAERPDLRLDGRNPLALRRVEAVDRLLDAGRAGARLPALFTRGVRAVFVFLSLPPVGAGSFTFTAISASLVSCSSLGSALRETNPPDEEH